METRKLCPVCDSVILGRKDKIYCSRKCKSIMQYENRVQKDAFYFKVDKHLKTNRKLLKKFNHKGYTTVAKHLLLREGFNPKFFTHYWKNAKGDVYLFVYEYGFLDLKKAGKDKYLIVEWQDYMNR